MFNFLQVFPRFLDYWFYAPLFLRLALGAIFLAHGWPKLAHDKAQFAGWLESMKFKPGKFWAWVVSIVEFFGALMLLAGFFTQLAALVLAIEFLVILFWFKRGQSFVARPDAPGMSWEFDFLIFCALLALLLLGPGPYSLDLPI